MILVQVTEHPYIGFSHSSSVSIFMSFSNEGDPVSLADPEYVEILGQAWARATPSNDDNWRSRTSPPIFVPSGTQVILRSTIINEEDNIEAFSAFYLDEETRLSLLFGNLLSHHMEETYLPKIKDLHNQALQNSNPFDDQSSFGDE
jgi:hypothetical protein